LSDAPSHIRRQPTGGALDVEQAADAVERLLRERRSGEVEVIEFTPHMRPTKNLGDIGGLAATGLVKRAKPGIAVGMQEAAEAGQVSARMLAFPVG
jgi:hypothetical protein